MEIYQSKLLGLDAIVMDGMADHRRLEPWAIRLANHTSALLRLLLGKEFPDFVEAAEKRAVPEGPHFVYEQAPDIFSGRRGRGPLKIAWDTNLLLDYFQYGWDLWQGDTPDLQGDEQYVSELECLQFVIGLWIIRDIRFKILPATIVDAKGRVSDKRRQQRIHAFDEFTHALGLVDSGEEETPPYGLLHLPESMLREALAAMPGGWDRILVKQAIDAGEHVFLTRDAKILRGQQQLRPFGLRPATPGDLFELLLGCGAFHCLMSPRCAYWPLMDTQRTAHLIRALGQDDRPAPA